MNRKLILIAGLLAVLLLFAGCGGNKSESKSEQQETTQSGEQNTAEPSQETTQTALVEMATPVPTATPAVQAETIENVLGTKTPTASQVILINQMGSEIAEIYIRPAVPAGEYSDEWGSELTGHQFILNNGDKAVYYYDGEQKDEDGRIVTAYDVRIGFTDEYKNECFFRGLPLKIMNQLRLYMSGTGDEGIPYARYTTATGNKEYSTLEEVKKRLAQSSGDDDDDDDVQDDDTDATPTPRPTTAPSQEDGNEDVDIGEDDDDAPDPGAAKAETFIGQSLGNLEAALGVAESSEYADEPETGRTGYHYYDRFTVSTTVDSNGNEIVAGVW